MTNSAADLTAQIASAQYSLSYFTYLLDADDDDIYTAQQLTIRIADLQAELDAINNPATAPTVTELQATVENLTAQIATATYSYNYFNYTLDATEDDKATALQLSATVKDLQAQLKAVKATIKKAK